MYSKIECVRFSNCIEKTDTVTTIKIPHCTRYCTYCTSSVEESKGQYIDIKV